VSTLRKVSRMRRLIIILVALAAMAAVGGVAAAPAYAGGCSLLDLNAPHGKSYSGHQWYVNEQFHIKCGDANYQAVTRMQAKISGSWGTLQGTVQQTPWTTGGTDISALDPYSVWIDSAGQTPWSQVCSVETAFRLKMNVNFANGSTPVVAYSPSAGCGGL